MPYRSVAQVLARGSRPPRTIQSNAARRRRNVRAGRKYSRNASATMFQSLFRGYRMRNRGRGRAPRPYMRHVARRS